MKTIVQKDNPVLREKAKEVPITDIPSPRIISIIDSMKEALLSQEDGVAIAAPQIGESLSIFVVSKKVFAMEKGDEKNLAQYNDMVFINPRIIKQSKTTKMLEEGCLSVRYLYGKVRRSTKATVQAYNEHGKHFTLGASGILAQIFQHEVDHLHGILFIDKAEGLEDLPPTT